MAIIKRIIIVCYLVFCFNSQALCQDKPIILEQGQPAPYSGYLFSEPQFNNLLILKANYDIDKKLWVAKEKIYQEAIKEARGHWWQGAKFNFVLGILVCVASAYVVGQVK